VIERRASISIDAVIGIIYFLPLRDRRLRRRFGWMRFHSAASIVAWH
jgi:hypothetical protein